ATQEVQDTGDWQQRERKSVGEVAKGETPNGDRESRSDPHAELPDGEPGRVVLHRIGTLPCGGDQESASRTRAVAERGRRSESHRRYRDSGSATVRHARRSG